MKKRGRKSFFGQKQFMIAAAVMLVAALAMTWVYMDERTGNSEDKSAKLESTEQVAEVKDTEQPAESVTKMLTPQKSDSTTENDTGDSKKDTAELAEKADNTDISEQSDKAQESEEIKTDTAADTETMTEPADVPAAQAELHFAADSGLNWPLQGNVILNYSMNQTTYFATLDAYKYNPAVIIAGEVSDRVRSAAAGKITDISTNEETGLTMTMDLGDGYTAIYGQLKEIPYEVGAYVESGSTIGYISEPTKYYSVEGSNLYFELQKDGTPVDPVIFFE